MKKNPNEPKVVVSGLVGWGACQRELDRCKEDERRELLIGLARQSGLQSAPALEYVARRLRYHADGGDCPVPGIKLRPAEVRFIEDRVADLLRPFMQDPRIPKMRFVHEKAVA